MIPIVPGAAQDALAGLLPFTAGMSELDREAAAYVCSGFTCRQPVTTGEDLARELAPEMRETPGH